MAGRVPVDSDRATVAKEMEAVFVQNLKYAADILSKVSDLLCPTYHYCHINLLWTHSPLCMKKDLIPALE